MTLFNKPRNAFVARFIGGHNVIERQGSGLSNINQRRQDKANSLAVPTRKKLRNFRLSGTFEGQLTGPLTRCSVRYGIY